MERKKRIHVEKAKVRPENLTPPPVDTITLTPEQSARLRKLWAQLRRNPRTRLDVGTSFEQFEAEFCKLAAEGRKEMREAQPKEP
jgi:hypothetical protein